MSDLIVVGLHHRRQCAERLDGQAAGQAGGDASRHSSHERIMRA
jgi:hypothetical protein